MNLVKSLGFFDPDDIAGKVHIIGCGSVGSTIAENLARCGVSNMVLYDFDKVESKNIVNQMFFERQVGMSKVEALAEILGDINADCKENLTLKPEGWQGEKLAGYVFLCPDSIEVRRDFCEKHKTNRFVKAVFDVRTMLTGAQHYAANWNDMKMIDDLLATMQFSHDEVKETVSACGVTLGVATTVRVISALAVSNFINFIKGKGLKKFIQEDNFEFWEDAF